MAKIRHEINLRDSVLSSTTALHGINGEGWVFVDTTQYSGTVTYYFEVIANNTDGADRNVIFGTSDTNIYVQVTIPSGTTSYTRFRSSSFTPSLEGRITIVQTSSNNTVNVKAARIVIIQDTGSDPLTNTETQIEIGNQETGKTNTTDAALTNPKYWYYDSSVWDGTLTCYAEVTYTSSDSMATTTIKLQEDNGSFASWADKVTIVNAGTATTATRVRSASFTPTTGRNYRIVTVRSSNMSNHSIYNAKIIVQQRGDTSLAGICDSYPESNSSTTYTVDSLGDGQSFTGDGKGLDSIKFYLARTGATGGTVTAYIYAHSGTFGSTGVPTGSALATSTAVNASTIGAISLITFNFTGTNRIPLVSGTKYFAVIIPSGITGTLTIGADSTSPTHGGNLAYNTGSWAALSSDDLIFYVYTSYFTKLEPQYLLANTAVGAGTGLQDFDTYYDPAEWDGVTNVYYHEGNNVASGTSDIKLQSDPNGTPADVTDSTITNIIERERSSAMTMPGTAQTIDVNQTGT